MHHLSNIKSSVRHSISLSVFHSQQIAFWWLLVPVEFLGFFHSEERVIPASCRRGFKIRRGSAGQRQLGTQLSSEMPSLDTKGRPRDFHGRQGNTETRGKVEPLFKEIWEEQITVWTQVAWLQVAEAQAAYPDTFCLLYRIMRIRWGHNHNVSVTALDR